MEDWLNNYMKQYLEIDRSKYKEYKSEDYFISKNRSMRNKFNLGLRNGEDTLTYGGTWTPSKNSLPDGEGSTNMNIIVYNKKGIFVGGIIHNIISNLYKSINK